VTKEGASELCSFRKKGTNRRIFDVLGYDRGIVLVNSHGLWVVWSHFPSVPDIYAVDTDTETKVDAGSLLPVEARWRESRGEQ
jgi:hypothetical protein